MGFIPEVKCPRCDRRYMALRTRCPYCGTSRHRRTGKSAETDNAMWKGIVGAALMLTLAVGVIVLISDARKEKDNAVQLEQQQQQEQLDASLEKSISSVAHSADEYVAQKEEEARANGEDIPDTTNETDVPEIPIESIKVFNKDTSRPLPEANSNDFDYDISVPIGISYNLACSVVPESRNDAAQNAQWTSSDTNVVSVLQSGKITAMGKGTAYIYCTIENAVAKIIVRVR